MVLHLRKEARERMGFTTYIEGGIGRAHGPDSVISLNAISGPATSALDERYTYGTATSDSNTHRHS